MELLIVSTLSHWSGQVVSVYHLFEIKPVLWIFITKLDKEIPFSEKEFLLFLGSVTNVIQYFLWLSDWSLHIKQEQAKGATSSGLGILSRKQSLTHEQIIHVRGCILQGAGLACCKLRVLCTSEDARIPASIQLPPAQSPIRAAIPVPLHNRYPSSHQNQQNLKMMNMLNQAVIQNLNGDPWIFDVLMLDEKEAKRTGFTFKILGHG